MKALKALENIKREAGTPYFSTLYDIDMWREDFRTVENALTALETIKNKEVDIEMLIQSEDVSEYNEKTKFSVFMKELTAVEFYILREVLD